MKACGYSPAAYATIGGVNTADGPGRDAWLGYDPDQRQAALHGLWAWCPSYGSPVRCEADHPGAIPDVTRLMRNGMWDRERKTWMLLDGAPP